MSIFDDLFDNSDKKKEKTPTIPEVKKQISTVKTELETKTSTETASKTEIAELKKILLELKESLETLKLKSEEAMPIVSSSSESVEAVKVLPSKKSSKKHREESSSTPDVNTENLEPSSDNQKT